MMENGYGEGHAMVLRKLRTSVVQLQGTAVCQLAWKTGRGPKPQVIPGPGQHLDCSLVRPRAEDISKPCLHSLTIGHCEIILNCNICGDLLCSSGKVMQRASRGWITFTCSFVIWGIPSTG